MHITHHIQLHHISTPRPEDGAKLYQPAERQKLGSISISLTRQILDKLDDTHLGGWLVRGETFGFNHRGGEAAFWSGRIHIISCECPLP